MFALATPDERPAPRFLATVTNLELTLAVVLSARRGPSALIRCAWSEKWSNWSKADALAYRNRKTSDGLFLFRRLLV